MVTKKDIALALGLSRGCVSQVLNNTPGSRVSPAVRQRIIEQAQRMGYASTSATAAGPRNGCIAYLFYWSYQKQRTYPGGWHLGMLYDFQQIAARHGQHVVFIGFSRLKESMNEAMHTLQLVSPQAIVLDGITPSSAVETLLKKPWPLVVAGAQPCAYEASWEGRLSAVAPDNDAMFRYLIQELVKRGARRIGIQFDTFKLYHSQLQLASYRKVLRELGLPHKKEWEYQGTPRLLAEGAAAGLSAEQCMDGYICTDYHLPAVMTLLGHGRFATLKSENIALYSKGTNVDASHRARIICPHLPISSFASAVHQQVTHLMRFPGQHRRILISE